MLVSSKQTHRAQSPGVTTAPHAAIPQQFRGASATHGHTLCQNRNVRKMISMKANRMKGKVTEAKLSKLIHTLSSRLACCLYKTSVVDQKKQCIDSIDLRLMAAAVVKSCSLEPGKVYENWRVGDSNTLDPISFKPSKATWEKNLDHHGPTWN